MRAFLDDTAQIIGPRFEFDQEVKGRSEREINIGKLVLRKAQLVYEEGKKLGGVRYISRADALLIRTVYLKKYSKPEEGKHTSKKLRKKVRKEETASLSEHNNELENELENKLEAYSEETAGAAPQSDAETGMDILTENGFDEYEYALRKQLVYYGNKLVEENLVQGTWGNLSARLDENTMLVTPSGIDYAKLTPKDMAKVDIYTLKYEGELKPTSEKVLHSEIYKNRTEIGAVIHTHSTYASVFAACEMPLPMEDEEDKAVFGEGVRMARYGLPSTEKLGINTAEALGDNFGVIMPHHGMAVCAEDMETAFSNAVRLETAAKKLLDRR